MQTNRLRPIDEEPPELPEFFGAGGPVEAAREPPPKPQSAVEHATTNMLMLALRALSQRTLIAAGNLFTLLTAASAFWLWLTICLNPSIYQIIAVSIYGAFVLALDWMILHRN